MPTRKIANNTYCQRRPSCCEEPGVPVNQPDLQCVAIKFHSTDVVTYHWMGGWGERISLDTGGWLTATTKNRINRYLPDQLKIISSRGRWLLQLREDSLGSPITHPYNDGIRIYFSGIWSIQNAVDAPEIAAQDAHNSRMDKLIQELSGIPMPYGYDGDYSGCGMCVRTDVGTLAGDAFHDKQHLIDHLIASEMPYNVWVVASEQVNPSKGRLLVPELAIRDLRKYLRNTLYVGAVQLDSGKRPAHIVKPRSLR